MSFQAGYLHLAVVANMELVDTTFPSPGTVLQLVLALISVTVVGVLSPLCCCPQTCSLFLWRSVVPFSGRSLSLRAAANHDLPQHGTHALELRTDPTCPGNTGAIVG